MTDKQVHVVLEGDAPKEPAAIIDNNGVETASFKPDRSPRVSSSGSFRSPPSGSEGTFDAMNEATKRGASFWGSQVSSYKGVSLHGPMSGQATKGISALATEIVAQPVPVSYHFASSASTNKSEINPKLLPSRLEEA
ncbi:hypothetical protein CVT26_007836 [Gymnopilus dilepis]|uniref:Uncharacterized protein n=1 Tax=Gymnopilus dilepis TaxID=231916 RepID=A0A409WEN6_9AGAR|nr:hypothetical protein CVT26_007836 [Gymnopilus dilepis]